MPHLSGIIVLLTLPLFAFQSVPIWMIKYMVSLIVKNPRMLCSSHAPISDRRDGIYLHYLYCLVLIF